ncbi:hypothetical protein H0H93_000733, partial [Arthromyces matolae]
MVANDMNGRANGRDGYSNGVNGHTNGVNGNVNGTHESSEYYIASNAYTLPDFSIDEARPIKVVTIGAGYSGMPPFGLITSAVNIHDPSGITAGIRFRQRVKNVDLTVYEANAGVGGAWHVNRYPGLACDIPSHG